MKKLIFILLFPITIFAQDIGGDYYVAHPDSTYSGMNTASDLNDGSYANPWATWNKAFETATAGDTVYIRGGVYYSTSAPTIANSGTRALPIRIFAYPGETPILDCSVRSGVEYNIGIDLFQTQFIHFKGLTIRNVWQSQYSTTTISYAWGVASVSSANMTFEDMTVHNIAGRAFWVTGGAWKSFDPDTYIFEYDTTRFINCDVYDLCDTISYFVYGTGYEFEGWAEGDTAHRPGNSADGWKTIHYRDNVIIWEGCRAWFLSDDGWDPTAGDGAERILNNCWAMATNKYYDICLAANWKSVSESWSYEEMEGNAYKFNFDMPSPEKNTTVATNCLAMFSSAGFYEIGGGLHNGIYYNNTSFKNYVGFGGVAACNSIYRNNIAYGSRFINEAGGVGNVVIYDNTYTESHNTWDQTGSWPFFSMTDTVTITDADFVYTDSATLVALFTAARGVDGSLPAYPLALASGSDLIDAGTEVISGDITYTGTLGDFTLTYEGLAPDIGAGDVFRELLSNPPVDPPTPSPSIIRHLGSGGSLKVYGSGSGRVFKF